MATKLQKASIAIRQNRGKDLSPKWDETEKMTADQYSRHWHIAMDFYRMEFNAKDLKPRVIMWMSDNGYTAEQIKRFKKIKDWRCNSTMGGVASCLMRGMPESRPDFNEGRSHVEWLKNAIQHAVNEGTHDIDEDELAEDKAKAKAKADVYVPSIQDRLREAAGAMSEELDEAIDVYITDPDAFDPKAFKVVNLLKGKGVKAAHARIIKGYFEGPLEEYNELLGKDPDPQLIEGYSSYTKRNQKKMQDFLNSIMIACDQIIGEAKINKAPRKKKVKPAEDLVKRLKFQKSDDSLGIVSVPPASIIGAQAMFVYSTKTRKIGYYIAMNSQGFEVKGTTILNFTDKSVQKTLRKPAEQLKSFKDLNTQKRMQTWFEKDIKTTEIGLNGRFNEEIVILKVFK
jgi:hypothetical protein